MHRISKSAKRSLIGLTDAHVLLFFLCLSQKFCYCSQTLLKYRVLITSFPFVVDVRALSRGNIPSILFGAA